MTSLLHVKVIKTLREFFSVSLNCKVTIIFMIQGSFFSSSEMSTYSQGSFPFHGHQLSTFIDMEGTNNFDEATMREFILFSCLTIMDSRMDKSSGATNNYSSL